MRSVGASEGMEAVNACNASNSADESGKESVGLISGCSCRATSSPKLRAMAVSEASASGQKRRERVPRRARLATGRAAPRRVASRKRRQLLRYDRRVRHERLRAKLAPLVAQHVAQHAHTIRQAACGKHAGRDVDEVDHEPQCRAGEIGVAPLQ